MRTGQSIDRVYSIENPAEAGLFMGGDCLGLAVDAVISYNAIIGGGCLFKPTADG